jgi:uncharacterized protein
MALAGYVVELGFGAAGLIPQERAARVSDIGFSWNYTSWLNIAFLALAAALVWRCWKTGGFKMLRMMEGSAEADQRNDAAQNAVDCRRDEAREERAPERR